MVAVYLSMQLRRLLLLLTSSDGHFSTRRSSFVYLTPRNVTKYLFNKEDTIGWLINN